MSPQKLISESFQRPIVFVDIETTGLSPQSAEIIEVAGIRIEEGKITQELTSLIQPKHYDIHPIITQITGIRNGDVADAPLFDEVANPFLSLFQNDALFIAHNVGFDFCFLSHAYQHLDILFEPDLFCTVKMSRALYGKSRKHNLETIINHYNISVDSRHRAYDDALVMWKFLQIIMEEKGLTTFSEAVAQQSI